MNRPVLGLVLGLVFGVLDGSTAYFSAPELRAELAGILFGSAIKGTVAGVVTGLVVRRTGSLLRGAVIGVVVAFLLAIPVAWQNANYYDNQSYWWKILLPPAVLGAFVGYSTVRFGRPARSKEASAQP